MTERVSDERLREVISRRAWDGEAVSMAEELLELRADVARVREKALRWRERADALRCSWPRSDESMEHAYRMAECAEELEAVLLKE